MGCFIFSIRLVFAWLWQFLTRKVSVWSALDIVEAILDLRWHQDNSDHRCEFWGRGWIAFFPVADRVRLFMRPFVHAGSRMDSWKASANPGGMTVRCRRTGRACYGGDGRILRVERENEETYEGRQRLEREVEFRKRNGDAENLGRKRTLPKLRINKSEGDQ